MLDLKQCLTLPDDYDWGGKVETPIGPYFHHQHGNKVLGVAHLDTVMVAKPLKEGSYIFAPQLDDRLGVWCLLNKLPAMGIQLDILLTTGEESCASTANYFSGHQYNWVVEFDRAGSDVVFYQYDEFAPYWPGKIGQGSYSDICDLELGVMCANVGIGYHAQHTRHCWADLRETNRQLKRFARFYNQYRDVRFDYSDSYNDSYQVEQTRPLCPVCYGEVSFETYGDDVDNLSIYDYRCLYCNKPLFAEDCLC